MRAEGSDLAHDPDGAVVVEDPGLADLVRERCPGVAVAGPGAASAVRAVVASTPGWAARAAEAGVPFLVAATGGEADWPPERLFFDRETLAERLDWLLDGAAATSLARDRAEARAWLEAIRSEERRMQEEWRRMREAERLRMAERRDAELARLEAELHAAHERIAELGAHIAGVEASRAWRTATALQRTAASLRRTRREAPAPAPVPEAVAPEVAQPAAAGPPGGAPAPADPAAPPLPAVDLVAAGPVAPEALEECLGLALTVWPVSAEDGPGTPGEAPVVAVLDPDARLLPGGLREALALMARGALDAVLTAERSEDPAAGPSGGEAIVPHGPWSALEAGSWALASGLVLVDRAFCARWGGLRPEAGWDAVHDLLLRAGEAARVGAVAVPGCARPGPLGPRAARRTIAGVLAEDLARRGVDGHLEAGAGAAGVHRVRPARPRRPLVSVIVPTRDAPGRLEAVQDGLARTRWRPLEVVIVDNGSRDPRALEALARTPHRVVRSDIPFNFSRLANRGAASARGEVLVLLNDDVEVRDPDWLEAMVDLAAAPGAGPVGALLRYPDGTIQHCGISVADGVPFHPHQRVEVDAAPSRLVRAPAHRLAVTAACMALDARLLRSLGGMEPLLRTSYNDVDLCLRAAARGRPAALTPWADLVHHESASRGTEATPETQADWLLFRSRWASVLAAGDPWSP